jgi:hypothetical protein
MNEIKIENVHIDDDLYLDYVSSPYEIEIVTFINVKFDSKLYPMFMQNFNNILKLNIINSTIDSKVLVSLIRNSNPHSLYEINLTGSNIEMNYETDFKWLGGLFALSKLILPLQINEDLKNQLLRYLNTEKVLFAN